MTLKFGIDATTLGLQRRLTQTTSEVNRSFERLSSGLRINRPSDDAAGLQIAESLAAEARILNQARRNVNDGISVLNIVESVVSEVTRIETRMAELAEQAANGSLDTDQRRAMNQEFFALSHEAQRIIDAAEFNGLNVTAGLQTELEYQQVSFTSGAGLNNSQIATSGDGTVVAYFNNTDTSLEIQNLITGGTTVISNITSNLTNDIQMSASGNVIAFQSTQDITGDNTSNLLQTFIYNVETGTMQQATNAQVAESGISGFSLSADGSTISFTSQSRYVDGGTLSDGVTTGDGTDYLYLMDLESGTFTEALAGANLQFMFNASFSSDSRFLTFGSNGNYTGENPDFSIEIFVLDTNDISNGLKQVTDIVGAVAVTPSPVVTSSGDVYFSIDYDLTGENPSNLEQLFKYDYASDSISQITHDTAGFGNLFTKSIDERSIIIASAADHTGENPNHYVQGFRYDIASGELTQSSSYDSVPPVVSFHLNPNGAQSYLYTTADLTGQNADGSMELFLLSTFNTPLDLTISLGGGAGSEISISLESVRDSAKSLGGLTISSQSAARGALDFIKRDLDSLGVLAGEIGANMSRLGYAANELSNRSLAYQDAASRIRDVDVAAEAANLARHSIVQQSIAEILKQTNLQGELLLSLLDIDS